MKFAEADPSDGYLIRAYAPGWIQIGERRFERSLILSPHHLLPDWPPQRLEQILPHHLDPLLELAPELLLLGTGPRQNFPEPALYANLLSRGLGLEIMDTGAACRTYNILMAEGRRVAAALLVP